MNPLKFSFMATTEEQTSFIAQPHTPTSMVLDLGCTRAMASRVAEQDLMKFCDQNSNCGIWYQIAETTSQFTFANSESTKCNQKLVACMYDREYVVQLRSLTSSSRVMFPFSCPCHRCAISGSSLNSILTRHCLAAVLYWVFGM